MCVISLRIHDLTGSTFKSDCDGETSQRFFIPGESNRMDLSASVRYYGTRKKDTPVFAVLQGAYESYPVLRAGF
jgi:hypothetical protein